VDRLPDGTLRIIDYKTGSDYGYAPSTKEGPLKGGRRMQAALYAHAAGVLLGATAGAWLLGKLRGRVIRVVFVIVLLGVSLEMLWKGIRWA